MKYRLELVTAEGELITGSFLCQTKHIPQAMTYALAEMGINTLELASITVKRTDVEMLSTGTGA